MDALVGLLLVLILGVVTWCVGSEGAWGAVLTFLCVLLSGILTMNFFEPVAALIEDNGGDYLYRYSDFLAFTGLFSLFTFLSRAGTDLISPTDIELDGRLYQGVRWLFAAATGYMSIAILLTALHTAPLSREFIGFRPERANLFEIVAPDRQWLAYVQHLTERILTTGRVFDDAGYTVYGSDQRVWPTFPIRYATRREDLATNAPRKSSAQAVSPGASSVPSGGPAF